MASVMAAVVGSVLGNTLFVWTAPLGKTRWWISASTLIGIALLGWVASLMIPKREAANPARRPPTHVVRQTLNDLRSLKTDRHLLAAAAATAFFWFLAALAQVNVYLLGTTILHISQEEVGALLGMLALGVAIGSVLAGLWSDGIVETGISPIGAAGILVTSVMMFVVTEAVDAGRATPFWSAFGLF